VTPVIKILLKWVDADGNEWSSRQGRTYVILYRAERKPGEQVF